MPNMIFCFELEGNDFSIFFIYKHQEHKVRVLSGNDLIEEKEIRSYEQLMNFVNSKFITVTDEHDREYLEAEIFFANLFNGCNYFEIGRNYRIKKTAIINN